MRNKIFLFVLIFLAVYFAFALYDNFVVKEKKLEPPKENILKIGEVEIKFEVADTAFERAEGLSGRESLAPKTGLLFVFEKSDFHGFWMKEMKFPIDMIWISEDKFIVHIQKSVAPETFPQIFKPQSLAKYVLEVESGFSEKNKVEIGESVVFPENF